jgi:hypothetical protein
MTVLNVVVYVALLAAFYALLRGRVRHTGWQLRLIPAIGTIVAAVVGLAKSPTVESPYVVFLVIGVVLLALELYRQPWRTA